MNSVDVLAKLYKLKDSVDGLTEDDRAFVTEMVKLHESGHVPNIPEILRIVEMRVPGEEIAQDSGIWTHGNVSVVFTSQETVIWRYMPLEQLFALLSKKVLHFSSLSAMGDVAEGQLPPRAFEETKKQLPPYILEGRGGMDADTMTAIMVAQRRTSACINCWFMNESDSLEMWQQYAPRNGAAIQSTVRRLGSALEVCDTPVTIGPVTYFRPDEEEKYVDEVFYGSLFIKHDPFRHEKELRALAYRVNIGCGVDICVNLEALIERLVLSPELKDWAVPFITEAIRRYGFGGCIEKSTLRMPNAVA
jgi:hypothetical protein